MTQEEQQALKRIESVEQRYRELMDSLPERLSERLSRPHVTELIALMSSTIEGLTPPNHRFRKMMTVPLSQRGTSAPENIEELLGVIQALKWELKTGNFFSFGEALRGELFSDYMDIADHLLAEGFKDAAATTAGSTLESHLRALCVRNAVPLKKPSGAPMLLSDMCRELCNKNVVSKLDQRNLESWTLLRNQSAHGDHTQYTAAQVRLMIDGIRDFITRMPA